MHAVAEGITHGFRLGKRAVDHMHAFHAARQQRMHDGPAGAAGAEHQGIGDAAFPAGLGGIEGAHVAVAIGIGGAQQAVVEPQRVGGADGARLGVGLGQAKGGVLVRHGNVGADVAMSREIGDEGLEILGRDFLGAVVARDAVVLEPVAVQLGGS